MIRFRYLVIALLVLPLGAAVPQGKPTTAQATKQPVAPSAVFPPLPKPDPNYHFPVGQTLVYRGEWRIFNAGTATLRLEQAGQEHRVLGNADASGSVALLYHVHDRFESFFSSSNFCSRHITKNIEEGARRVDAGITFDYQRRKAVLDQKNLKKGDSKHDENDIPGCVTDVLSAIYYVGALPLQPGKTFSFPLNDGGKTVTVDVHVEATEQVKTPAGTFNTIRVQPEASAGLLKEKGKIWVWYSNDAARVPVQMRARMFWGTATFQLERIEKK